MLGIVLGFKDAMTQHGNLLNVYFKFSQVIVLETVKHILQCSAMTDINNPNSEGIISLHYAAHKQAPFEIHELLLSSGANVNLRTFNYRTPMSFLV